MRLTDEFDEADDDNLYLVGARDGVGAEARGFEELVVTRLVVSEGLFCGTHGFLLLNMVVTVQKATS